MASEPQAAPPLATPPSFDQDAQFKEDAMRELKRIHGENLCSVIRRTDELLRMANAHAAVAQERDREGHLLGAHAGFIGRLFDLAGLVERVDLDDLALLGTSPRMLIDKLVKEYQA